MYLLQSQDVEVQTAALAALGNIAAVNGALRLGSLEVGGFRSLMQCFVEANKATIANVGGLEPLVHLMQSPNTGVVCNAVGCITNLSTHDENKGKIAACNGALVTLARLARSRDVRVQRNATGALLNMTHTAKNRNQLIRAGAIPVLVATLAAEDSESLYFAAAALSNVAVDEKFQLDIVREQGLPPLLRLLLSRIPQITLAAVACVRNISIHPSNEIAIVEAGFLSALIELFSSNNEEIACHALSTVRNLAALDQNKVAVVELGGLENMSSLLANPHLSAEVAGETTACLAVLALVDELKPKMVHLLDTLISLTDSNSLEVQGNAAAAIGNIAAGVDVLGSSLFSPRWEAICRYIQRFLESGDQTLSHIALWTLLQFVERSDEIKARVTNTPTLVALIPRFLQTRPPLIDLEEDVSFIEEEVVGLARTLLEHLDPQAKPTTDHGNA
ncbi:Vacuolar protein 8 [Borealophlyctis nickersoniae]|nr:Vacuolar protein 8 [Borealophlyctis nickersoniae]